MRSISSRGMYTICSVLVGMFIGSFLINLGSNEIFNFVASSTNTFGTEFSELTSKRVFNGIETVEWCQLPQYPPLPFENCNNKDFLFRIPVYGGLTNALLYILKGVMWAYEEDVCFFVEEKGPLPAQLPRRNLPLQNIDPFLERYFEPMSMPRDHKTIQWAMKNHKFIDPDALQIQYHEFGRSSGGLLPLNNPLRHQIRDIPSLSWYGKDNIITKKWMLRRLVRIKTWKRINACSQLSKYDIAEEYMAMSVRKSDKETEYKGIDSLQPYIDKAEIAIKTHFDGKVPKIFVASDDCSVMEEFRKLRPTWSFVSECDEVHGNVNGFFLSDVKTWTEEQTEMHYDKFLTELIAMASAKYFIGVSTTNVSLWVYFMRHMDAQDDTWVFVDRSDVYPH